MSGFDELAAAMAICSFVETGTEDSESACASRRAEEVFAVYLEARDCGAEEVSSR